MIAVTTRFWDAREKEASPKKIIEFVERASEFADMIIVAINDTEDRSNAVKALSEFSLETLHVLTVRPWGYTFAMNALVYEADRGQQRYLLSHSVEIHMKPEMLNILREQMDDETLCVGARLWNHEFYPGRTVPGTGVTVPWNTCCLWNLKHLPYLGFPLIGDASFDETQAGVEEVTAISLHQFLYPDDCRAKLVELPGIEWHTEFPDDPARRLKHDRKIRMKIQRPRLQLGLLTTPEPKVEHIGQADKQEREEKE